MYIYICMVSSKEHDAYACAYLSTDEVVDRPYTVLTCIYGVVEIDKNMRFCLGKNLHVKHTYLQVPK